MSALSYLPDAAIRHDIRGARSARVRVEAVGVTRLAVDGDPTMLRYLPILLF
jgi:hypothetical protein